MNGPIVNGTVYESKEVGVIVGPTSGWEGQNPLTSFRVIDGMAYPTKITTRPISGANYWYPNLPSDEWKYDDQYTISRVYVDGNDGINKKDYKCVRSWAGYVSGRHVIDFTSADKFKGQLYIGFIPATFGDVNSFTHSLSLCDALDDVCCDV
jgi:hypothetical protein